MRAKLIAIALSAAFGGGGAGAIAQPRDPAGAGEAAGRPAQVSEIQLGASRLIGMPVRGSGGEELGTLKDVVVDLAGGRAHYAVLEAGGILDVGDRHYAYPVSEFSTSPDGRHLIMTIDREALKKARGFDDGSWPDFNDSEFQARTDRRASRERPGAERKDLRRVSELLGADVKNRSGEQVGQLRDVIVNLATGEVPSALIAYDPAIGFEQRMVSVPPARLVANRDRDEVVINMTPSELKSAPSAVGAGTPRR